MRHLTELGGLTTYEQLDRIILVRAGKWAEGEHAGQIVTGLTLKHIKMTDTAAVVLHFPEKGARPEKIQIQNPTHSHRSDSMTDFLTLLKHGFDYRGFHEGFRQDRIHVIAEFLHGFSDLVTRKIKRSLRPEFGKIQRLEL